MNWIFYATILSAGTLSCFFFVRAKLCNSDVSLRISFFFSVILLLFVFTRIIMELFGYGSGARRQYVRHQREYMELGGRYLGVYLSRLQNLDVPSNKILVIDYPKNFYLIGSQAEFSNRIVAGLKEGLKQGGEKYQVSRVVRVSGENTGLSWLKAAEFDKIILENHDIGIVVSLVGIPSDYENMTFQDSMDNPPKFVFFGGDIRLLHPVIRSGTVIASVNLCPGKSLGGSKKPDFNNIEESFFDNFILIDSGSVDFAMDAFPVLFK